MSISIEEVIIGKGKTEYFGLGFLLEIFKANAKANFGSIEPTSGTWSTYVALLYT